MPRECGSSVTMYPQPLMHIRLSVFFESPAGNEKTRPPAERDSKTESNLPAASHVYLVQPLECVKVSDLERDLRSLFHLNLSVVIPGYFILS